MDYGSLDTVIQKRERGYIWLEQRLKKNLAVTTLFVTACFLFIFILEILYGTGGQKEEFRIGFFSIFLLAVIGNVLWQFVSYRKEYREYLSLQEYLEAFENGDYEYQGTENGIELGIHSQMIEQLERLGRAFSVIKEQLVEEKERTNELVTDISHQIKTPILAIHMSLELLQDTQTTEAEKQEFLERAQKEVKKLHSLLETLFQLSRLERGMVHLAPEYTSLKETLIRAVNGVYLKANEKHIEIEMEEFQDISVCCDVKWTAEAFANVIENSVKYSPEGSRVKIRVEPYISYISVEVEDQGMGIDKKEYTNIFQRFYRGKEAERTGLEGAGVGLYLVRKILEEQGGNVRVLKSGAWGTTFQMVLPKENEACEYKK